MARTKETKMSPEQQEKMTQEVIWTLLNHLRMATDHPRT